MRNWPGLSGALVVRDLFKEYLRITAPLILLTYGREATDYSFSGHDPRTPLISIAGSPHLTTVPGCGCVIVVPCIHPASLHYGSCTSQLRNLFQTVHLIFLLAVQVAVEKIEVDRQNREQLCRTVLKRLEYKLHTTGIGAQLATQQKIILGYKQRS